MCVCVQALHSHYQQKATLKQMSLDEGAAAMPPQKPYLAKKRLSLPAGGAHELAPQKFIAMRQAVNVERHLDYSLTSSASSGDQG